jgi:hypothetical protein
MDETISLSLSIAPTVVTWKQKHKAKGRLKLTERKPQYTVPFTPLEERVAQDAPELLSGLDELRNVMGDHDFEQYINSLVSMRKVDDQLLLITKRGINRSILTNRFLPSIKAIFAAKLVRIVTM